MKKLIVMLFFTLLLTGCQTGDEEIIDYGQLIESSVTEYFDNVGDETKLNYTMTRQYNDHNKVVEEKIIKQDGFITTQIFSYDDDDHMVIEQITSDDHYMETIHSYSQNKMIKSTIYELGEESSKTEYEYDADGDYKAYTTLKGRLMEITQQYSLSDKMIVLSVTNHETKDVLSTKKTYDHDRNVIEILHSLNDEKIERVEFTYDEHQNNPSSKRYRYDGETEYFHSEMVSHLTYDQHNNVVKEEKLLDGKLIKLIVTTYTYKN